MLQKALFLVRRIFCSIFLHIEKFPDLSLSIIGKYLVFSPHTSKYLIIFCPDRIELILGPWIYFDFNHKSAWQKCIGINTAFDGNITYLHFATEKNFRLYRFRMFPQHFQYLFFLPFIICPTLNLMFFGIDIFRNPNKNIPSSTVQKRTDSLHQFLTLHLAQGESIVLELVGQGLRLRNDFIFGEECPAAEFSSFYQAELASLAAGDGWHVEVQVEGVIAEIGFVLLVDHVLTVVQDWGLEYSLWSTEAVDAFIQAWVLS